MSNVIFQPPPGLGWSVVKRPKFSTITLPTTSGRGQLRIALQVYPIWEYEFLWEYLLGGEQTGLNATSSAQNGLEQLMGFYLARQGGFDSFLYRDPNDNSVSGMPFATGDGATTAFQLQRNIGQGVDIVQNVDSSVSAPAIYKSDFQGIKNLLTFSDGCVGTGTNLTGQSMPWFSDNPAATALATPNAAMAPDGSNNATKLTLPGAPIGQWSGWMQSINTASTTTGPLAGRTFTFSVWMRADAPVNTNIFADSGSPSFQNAGTLCSITTQWKQFWVTISYTVTDQGWRVFWRNSSASTQTFYIWGAQFEESSTVTAYQSVGAVQGGPTLQYSTARTNLLIHSQDFETGWGLSNSLTVTPDNTIAPDGTSTADKLNYPGGTDAFFSQSSSAPITSGSTYTLSIWLKVASGTLSTKIGVQNNAGTVTYGTFTCAVTTKWQRFLLPVTTSAAEANCIVGGFGTLSGGAGNFFAWGAQLEAGSAATPYIPTTSATVTVTDYTLGSTGIVTFANAPASGALLSWTGSYLYRLHFADDSNDFEEFMYQIWTLKKLKMESVIT